MRKRDRPVLLWVAFSSAVVSAGCGPLRALSSMADSFEAVSHRVVEAIDPVRLATPQAGTLNIEGVSLCVCATGDGKGLIELLLNNKPLLVMRPKEVACLLLDHRLPEFTAGQRLKAHFTLKVTPDKDKDDHWQKMAGHFHLMASTSCFDLERHWKEEKDGPQTEELYDAAFVAKEEADKWDKR